MRLAIVPARGGSVRIPRKNIREFWEYPIIGFTIHTLQDCKLFDEVVVSTDDEQIAAVAVTFGAKIHWRETDDGTRGTQEVAKMVLDARADVADDDLACVMYATAPLVKPADLICAAKCLGFGDAFVMAVGTEPLRDAGAFYLGLAAEFRTSHPLIHIDTRMYPLPENRICDINTEEDWTRAEQLYLEMNHERG